MPGKRTPIHPAIYVLGLCPLIAVSDTVINALGIGVATLIVITVSSLLTTAAARWLPQEIRMPTCLLILATIAGCVTLLLDAWFHELHRSLGLFLPLLVANYALQRRIEKSSQAEPIHTVTTALTIGLTIALALLVLGIAREIVGRGSVLHEAGRLLGAAAARFDLQLFRADMGFLLATLPPGAFISAGLLLAARNWWTQRRNDDA